jgi:23S rRNA pseudouridine1911/1915/1917 synthase
MNSIATIFDNQDLAVLDKPSNIVVHKINTHDNQPTLVEYISKKWPEINKSIWKDKLRPGIVHRLDKDTSGLIVIAKNPQAYFFLQKQFKNHTIKKTYTLLCIGKTQQKGTIKTYTHRDPKKYNKQKTSFLNFSWQKGKSKEAITKYTTISHYTYKQSILSLVKAQIITGRTHQIRNHFKFIDHPIIGDQMYYTKQSKFISDKLGLKHQFLHSSTIRFQLPNKIIKNFTSPIPSNLSNIISKMTLIN